MEEDVRETGPIGLRYDSNRGLGQSAADSNPLMQFLHQSGKNVTISRNTLNTNTDGGYGGHPTIDTLLVNGVENLLIDYNNITHIDVASEGSRYYYTVDLYSFTGAVENNNIIVNTTAGVDRAGTAYPIQLTGPFTVNVNNN